MPQSTVSNVVIKQKCQGNIKSPQWSGSHKKITDKGAGKLLHILSNQIVSQQPLQMTSTWGQRQTPVTIICWEMFAFDYHGHAAAQSQCLPSFGILLKTQSLNCGSMGEGLDESLNMTWWSNGCVWTWCIPNEQYSQDLSRWLQNSPGSGAVCPRHTDFCVWNITQIPSETFWTILFFLHCGKNLESAFSCISTIMHMSTNHSL